MKTIDHYSACVKDGKIFEVSGYTTIAGSGTYEMLAKVGANGLELSNFYVYADDGPILIQLFEEPTVSADGTSLSAFNRNRNASDNPQTIITHTPTTTDDGTAIYTARLPLATSGSNPSIGDLRFPLEVILKSNTYYMIRLTNQDTSSLSASFGFLWCE